VYRRSTGVVYARETRAARTRTAEHAIRDLAVRSAIAPTVLASLPVSYRNLFTGQININESFFFGRADKVRAGAAVVTGDRSGGLRTVLVAGARGSGKTTLCQQIAIAAGGRGHWVTPPASGAASRQAFRDAFETALAGRGSPIQLASRLAPGSLVVIDDLDLWWERRPGGLDAIDEICELVAATGDRVGYLLSGGSPAIRLIGALRPLSRLVYADLECQPLAARSLEQVIMARHASTGLKLRLGTRSRKGRRMGWVAWGGDGLGSWTRARLFDAHFDYARGNVGYALRSWVAHVGGCADGVVTVRTPTPLDWDAIDDLSPPHVAVLVELVLHKTATLEKLVRTTGQPEPQVADSIAELCAIGLAVQNRRRIVQINPFVHVPVIEWLNRRQLA